MSTDDEIKINARGLSAPGPRLMVETALEKQSGGILRVVVTTQSAMEDLTAYFADKRIKTKVDKVGDEYHVLADTSATAMND